MKIFSFFNGWNFKITSSKSKAPLEKKIEGVPSKKTADAAVFRRDESYRDPIPKNQQQLLLHAPKELHTFIGTAAIPELEASHDILIRIQVIGLNPIDWKASAYNFGLPQLPCVSGRDFVGVVIKSSNSSSRIKPGDLVRVFRHLGIASWSNEH